MRKKNEEGADGLGKLSESNVNQTPEEKETEGRLGGHVLDCYAVQEGFVRESGSP